jgi:enoyl-CoA hydratase
MAYDTILLEKRGRVGIITFNRPKALNALSSTIARPMRASAPWC